MLRNLWLKFLRWWMPAQGTHSTAIESGAFPIMDIPAKVYDDFWSRGVRVDDEDFPVTCSNGCPDGHRGRHKFSCPALRETRADPIPFARPYVPGR